MWRIFDYLPFVNGRRLSAVVGLTILAWAYFFPLSFRDETQRWGKHQIREILSVVPTTTTTMARGRPPSRT